MDTQREMDAIYTQYRQGSDDQPELPVNEDTVIKRTRARAAGYRRTARKYGEEATRWIALATHAHHEAMDAHATRRAGRAATIAGHWANLAIDTIENR